MRVWLAVGGCVLAGVALLSPLAAGPMTRIFATVLIFGLATSFVWPFVTHYPLAAVAPFDPFPAADRLVAGPVELHRLEHEMQAVGRGGALGPDTLLHLRYVARFRLVVSHRLDADLPADLRTIEQLTSPAFRAIVGPWPPDAYGQARPPTIPAHELRGLIDRLEAL